MTENQDKLVQVLEQQNVLLRQMDWKLWVLVNVVCDALKEQGLLKNDPRDQ